MPNEIEYTAKMTPGFGDLDCDGTDSNITTESEIVSECTQPSDHSDFTDRLLAIILQMQCNDETKESLSWFSFLKSFKKKLESNPQVIVEILKNWLRDD